MDIEHTIATKKKYQEAEYMFEDNRSIHKDSKLLNLSKNSDFKQKKYIMLLANDINQQSKMEKRKFKLIKKINKRSSSCHQGQVFNKIRKSQ